MKYSLRTLIVLVVASIVLVATAWIAYQYGLKEGRNEMAEIAEVLTMTGGMAGSRTDKTTSELLDELMAGLEP